MPKKAKKADKCATKGCRRKVIAKGKCAKCAAATVDLDAPLPEIVAKKQPVFKDPLDSARRLTQVELLKLSKLGANLESSLLQIRLFKYELMEVKQVAEQQLREKLEQMEQERKTRVERMQQLRKQYDQLTSELSKKYGVEDPKKMIVDTETGLIHEADSI